jgi:hypothetical protein
MHTQWDSPNEHVDFDGKFLEINAELDINNIYDEHDLYVIDRLEGRSNAMSPLFLSQCSGVVITSYIIMVCVHALE